MKTAIVLHSVSDAEHCVENRLYEGNMLFSTHPSVNDYLKEKPGLNCVCLSKFMSPEELIDRMIACIETVENALKELDSSLAPTLNKKFNLKINYFMPLYFFYYGLQSLAYASFVDCLKKATDIYKLEKIIFYDYRFDKILNLTTTVSDLIPLFFVGMQTEVIKVTAGKGTMESKFNFNKAINTFVKLKYCGSEMIFDRISAALYKSRVRKFCDAKKTIIMAEPLYDLGFLVGRLSKYNVLYYDLLKDNFLGFEKQALAYDIKLDFKGSALIKNHDDPFVKLLLKDIEEDFTNNASRYLSAIRLIEKVNSKYPISLGIWGGSPAWATRAMIFEYLSSKGIKTVGTQHGGLYGEAWSPWNLETDFNRCDYYVSWGFTRDDLERLYPSKKIHSEISPLGKTTIVKNRENPKKIDFLFPLTNSMSMLQFGMIRLAPDKVAERQEILLEYLNSLKSCEIYIKPFINCGYHNCSTWGTLKRLKNLKVVNNVFLTDFLLRYSPKAVLMEVPSSPLFDVLPLDTEIFLMDDPVNPYEERALDELKRRVHYCEDTNEVIAKMDLFMMGKLEKKRDDTFYRHYVYKDGTEEKILNLIDTLVEKG